MTNSTPIPEGRQRLRLCGPCVGCGSKTPRPDMSVQVTRDTPPGLATWLCASCADAVPWHPSLQRRIDRVRPGYLLRPSGVFVTLGAAQPLTFPACLADAQATVFGVPEHA